MLHPAQHFWRQTQYKRGNWSDDGHSKSINQNDTSTQKKLKMKIFWWIIRKKIISRSSIGILSQAWPYPTKLQTFSPVRQRCIMDICILLEASQGEMTVGYFFKIMWVTFETEKKMEEKNWSKFRNIFGSFARGAKKNHQFLEKPSIVQWDRCTNFSMSKKKRGPLVPPSPTNGTHESMVHGPNFSRGMGSLQRRCASHDHTREGENARRGSLESKSQIWTDTNFVSIIGNFEKIVQKIYRKIIKKH